MKYVTLLSLITACGSGIHSNHIETVAPSPTPLLTPTPQVIYIPGPAGKDGNSCSVSNGGLISCTDGTSYSIPTPQPGQAGVNGVNGSSCTISYTGLITCGDGSSFQVPPPAVGQAGTSCSVQQVSNGAIVTCGDGTTSLIVNGTNGTDGSNGANGTNGTNAVTSAYSIVNVIYPCGQTSGFNEVLFQCENGTLLAHYADGANQFLTVLTPNNYVTTDTKHCYFTVTSDNQIINEHR